MLFSSRVTCIVKNELVLFCFARYFQVQYFYFFACFSCFPFVSVFGKRGRVLSEHLKVDAERAQRKEEACKKWEVRIYLDWRRYIDAACSSA